jgi:hypothetical protein
MLGVHVSVECVESSRRDSVSLSANGTGSAIKPPRVPHPCRVLCDRVGILTFSRFIFSGKPKSNGSYAYRSPRAPSLNSWLRLLEALLIVLVAGWANAHTEPTIEELKARVSAANVGEKAKICLEIAEMQLNAADKQYTADDIEKAQASLTDVVAFSELARDYSVQSHKHQKQTEIAIRSMTRKLNDLLHVVGREEQGPLKDAIKHLERVRDDLLLAMFPKGAK